MITLITRNYADLLPTACWCTGGGAGHLLAAAMRAYGHPACDPSGHRRLVNHHHTFHKGNMLLQSDHCSLGKHLSAWGIALRSLFIKLIMK